MSPLLLTRAHIALVKSSALYRRIRCHLWQRHWLLSLSLSLRDSGALCQTWEWVCHCHTISSVTLTGCWGQLSATDDSQSVAQRERDMWRTAACQWPTNARLDKCSTRVGLRSLTHAHIHIQYIYRGTQTLSLAYNTNVQTHHGNPDVVITSQNHFPKPLLLTLQLKTLVIKQLLEQLSVSDAFSPLYTEISAKLWITVW